MPVLKIALQSAVAIKLFLFDSPQMTWDCEFSSKVLPHQDEYQTLKDNVIRGRARIAEAIDSKPALEKEIHELSLQLQELELKAAPQTAAIRLTKLGIESRLSYCQKQLEEFEPRLELLQAELAHNERLLSETPASHTQVLQFRPQKDALGKRIEHVIAEPEVTKEIQRIRFSVLQSRVRTEVRPVAYKSLAEYQQFADFVRHQPLDELTVNDLRHCISALKSLIGEIEASIPQMEGDEKLLLSHIRALDTEYEFWGQRLNEAQSEGELCFAKRAQAKSSELKVAEKKIKPLLAELRNQISDLKTYKLQFRTIQAKMLSKLTEFENLDFSPKA